MADNLVSKFTVNSQGTDIEVKIKDADARNLIAQEISDRASAVTTITNNINKEINDRENADAALQGKIATEITNREEADSQLQKKLNDVITNREEADSELQKKLYKNFILISDSYGTVDGNFVSILSPHYPNGHFTAIGGTGFGSSVYITDTWKTMLDALVINKPENITAIYCIGGANDANLLNDGRLTVSTLDSYIDQFVEDAKSKYPNATIYLCMLGWNKTADITGYINARNRYLAACTRHNNVSYIYGLDMLFKNLWLLNDNDAIHPTATGSQMLATLLAPVINTGNTCVDFSYGYFINIGEDNDYVTWYSGIESHSNAYMIISFTPHNCEITIIGNEDNYYDIMARYKDAFENPTIETLIELFTIKRLIRTVPKLNNAAYTSINASAGYIEDNYRVDNVTGGVELIKDDGIVYERLRISATGHLKQILTSGFTFEIPLISNQI